MVKTNFKSLLVTIFTLTCLNANAQNVAEDFYANNQEIVIASGIFLLACLICYIIARVKSNRGQLVLTANKGDKALLIITAVCLFVTAFFWGNAPATFPFPLILYITAGVCFCWTIYFSIRYNLGNVIHILISCFAKIFIIWLFVILLFLLLVILIISIVIFFMNKNDREGEYILLKYDSRLDAFIGYKY